MASRCDGVEASRAARGCAARGVRVPAYDRDRVAHRRRALRARRVSSRPPGVLSRRCARAGSALGHRGGLAAQRGRARRAGAAGSALHARRARRDSRTRASSARSRSCWSRRKSPSAVLAAPRRSRTSRSSRSTVTEKGYCLARGRRTRFRAHAKSRTTSRIPRAPRSAHRSSLRGPARRRELRLRAANVVSCDNLVGQRPASAARSRRVRAQARCRPGALDRRRSAVSAHDGRQHHARDRRRAARRASPSALGVVDRWPVQREAFTQWVIEDCMRGAAARLGGARRDDHRRRRRIRARQAAAAERRAFVARLPGLARRLRDRGAGDERSRSSRRSCAA